MLASTLANLADSLVRLHQFEEAETALGRARDINEGLARDFPDRPDHRQQLALRSLALGELFAYRARDREARDALERAYEIQRRLTKDFPYLSVSRHYLAVICYHASVHYATLTGRDDAWFVEVGPGTVVHNMLSRGWLDVKRARTDDPSGSDARGWFTSTVEKIRDDR